MSEEDERVDVQSYDEFMRFNHAMHLRNEYGRLINWRGDVIDDPHHELKVLSGRTKILRFVSKTFS